MKKEKTIIEAGAFVKNLATNSYELLFIAESDILAKGRAKEEAADRNKYCNAAYDLNDIILKHRTVIITEEYSEWNEDANTDASGDAKRTIVRCTLSNKVHSR